MIQNCSACGSLATARSYLYLRLFCVSISSLTQYRMQCWICFAQYVTVMSKEYYFRWPICGIDGLQLPDEPENLATVFANLDPPKLSCPTQIQMEKNTGANTSTSQIQTANTSENHEETVHLAACGYCHFLPSWTILGCALDKSIFYCCCRS